MICSGIEDGAFLQSVLGFVDCQAQTIGSQGYQALAAPGSPVSLLLSTMMTLVIALFGYRMLLGEIPGVRDGVLTFVKLGVVLALATSWAAYHTLVYDIVVREPAALVARVGTPAGLPGVQGDLANRLGQVDASLTELGRLGLGSSSMSSQVENASGNAVTVTVPTSDPPSIFSPFALGTARLTFLIATIASFACVRLIAGLLLALGPLFIGFLLFDGTRSLFEGWVRGLVAAAIGAVAVTALLAVELSLLEPWLATLLQRRQAQLPIGGAGTELLVVTFSFALTLLGGLGMAARMVIGFRLPESWRALPNNLQAVVRSVAPDVQPARGRETPAQSLSRAAAVAEAVAQVERRESQGPRGGVPAAGVAAGSLRDMPSPTLARLGQSYRRTRTRVSTSATRRDRPE